MAPADTTFHRSPPVANDAEPVIVMRGSSPPRESGSCKTVERPIPLRRACLLGGTLLQPRETQVKMVSYRWLDGLCTYCRKFGHCHINSSSVLEVVFDEAEPVDFSGEMTASILRIIFGLDSVSRTAAVTASWFTLPAPWPVFDSGPSFLNWRLFDVVIASAISLCILGRRRRRVGMAAQRHPRPNYDENTSVRLLWRQR